MSASAIPTPTPPASKSARSARWWRYTVLAVSAVAAAVLSYAGLYGFAGDTGSPADTAWMFPIAVDVLAAGALTYYILDKDAVAHVVAIVVVAASSIMNGLHHLYAVENSGQRTIAPTAAVFAAGALAPVVLYVNTALYARHRRKDQDDPGLRQDSDRAAAGTARDRRDPDRRPTAQPDPRGAHDTDPARDQGDRRVDQGDTAARRRRPRNTAAPTHDQLVAILRRDHLTHLSADEVKKQHGVGKDKALRALAAARETETLAAISGPRPVE